MSDFNLVLGADARKLKDGEEGLDALADKAEKTESRTQKATGKMTKAFDLLGGNIKNAAFVAVEALGTLAASYASYKTIEEAVTSAIAFNRAVSETSTLIQGTPEQIDKISSAARTMAMTFGKDATEEVKGFYEALSAGAGTIENAQEIVNVANKAAIGGATDTATAVDILTSALNVYSKEGLKAADASDALFVGVVAGKTTMEELSGSMGLVLPIAEVMGVSFDSVTAAVAALTEGGIKTSEAVTGVRASLNAVLNPSSDATKLAKRLGIDFSEAGLRAKGFGGFMADIVTKTQGSATAIQTLFGSVEATTTALAFSGTAGKAYNDVMDQMAAKAGATQGAFDKMHEELAGRLDQAMATFADILLSIGNVILPVLVPALQVLAAALHGVVDAISAVVDVGKWFLDQLIIPMGSAIMGLLIPALDDAAKSFVGFLAAIVPQPLQDFFRLIVDSAQTVAGWIGTVVKDFGILNDAITGTTTWFAVLSNIAGDIGTHVVSALQSVGAAALAMGFNLVSSMASAIDGAITSVVRFGNVAANTFEGAFNAIKAIWSALPNAIGDLVIQAANSMIRGINDMLGKAVVPINLFVDGINAVLGKIGSSISIPQMSAPAVSELSNSYAGAATSAANAASDAFNSAMQHTPLKVPDLGLGKVAEDALAYAKTYALASQTYADAAASPIASIGALETVLQGTGKSAVGAGQDLAGMGDKIAETTPKAAKGIDGLAASGSKAHESLTDAEKAAEAFRKELEKPMIAAIDSLSAAIGDFIVGKIKSFKDVFKSIVDGFKTMISQMIATAIANPIKIALGLGGSPNSALAGAGNAAGGAPGGGGTLSGLMSGISGIVSSFMGGFSAMFKSFGSGGFAAAGKTFSSLLGGIDAGLKGFAGALGAIAAPLAVVGLIVAAFHKTTKILATGLTISMKDLNAVIDQFTTKKTSSFFGLISNTSTSTTPLDPATAEPIKIVIGQLQTNIMDAAKSLGIGSDAFKNFAYEMTVDTMGMTQDQALKALQDKLGELGDAFAGMVPGLAALKKPGEGATDTLNRLATALTSVQSMTDTLGLAFDLVGLAGASVASKLADAFGGLDAMASATSNYYQKFYTQAERNTIATRQATEALAALSLTMPQTRDKYRAMIESLDLTTASGQKMFAALVSLSGVMDQVLPSVSNLTASLATLVGSTTGQLDSMIASTQSAMQAAQQAASSWYQAASQLRTYIDNLRGAQNDMTTTAMRRAYAEARFQTLLAQALAGNTQAYGQLTGAADALLSNSKASAQTAFEAAKDQARVLADLSKAAGVADISGGQQDVIAGLLGKQKDLLTSIKEYLSSGGVLKPANIDALNAQLGSLQGAIKDAKSVDYAQVIAKLDVTATIVDQVADPDLRRLLTKADHEIEGSIAFTVNTDGMTPAERYLALRATSEHLRTIGLLADDSKLSAGDATLALQADSLAEKTIRLAVDNQLSADDRLLALSQANEAIHTVNFVLGKRLKPADRTLALMAVSEATKTIHFAVTDIAPLYRGILFANSSNTLRTINLALAWAMPEPLRHLVLAQASSMAKTVNFIVGSKLTDTDKAIALTESALITKKITVDLGKHDAKALRIGLAESDTLVRSVSAVLAGKANFAANLAMADSSSLTRTVIATMNDKALTADQKAFLHTLTGAAAGKLTLGGTFQWDPSTGFQTWLATTTKGNIADPLTAMTAPMAALQTSLSDLATAVRAQSVLLKDTLDQQAKAAKLKDAQAQLASLSTNRQGAVAALQKTVDAVNTFDAQTGGWIGYKGQHADPTVGPEGKLNYKADYVYNASAADLAQWHAVFWADGGLEDQMINAAKARAKIDAEMARLRKKIIDLGGVPGFARGGAFGGGLRIVGENGPELEATGPARLYSASQTKAMMSGGPNDPLVSELQALREEVKALREEQRQLNFNSAVANKKTSETLRKWDTDGMPAVRT
jgi:TP901 family phage tail tape measure protein